MSETIPTTDDIQRLVYECGSSATVPVTWEGFNAWLAERDREKQAQAWEEGHKTVFIAENPYRQGENK